jgi:hypothetical protein
MPYAIRQRHDKRTHWVRCERSHDAPKLTVGWEKYTFAPSLPIGVSDSDAYYDVKAVGSETELEGLNAQLERDRKAEAELIAENRRRTKTGVEQPPAPEPKAEPEPEAQDPADEQSGEVEPEPDDSDSRGRRRRR